MGLMHTSGNVAAPSKVELEEVAFQLEREKRKRHAEISRLERDCKLIRRSISEARHV